MDPSQRLHSNDEKKRYALHENSLENRGYRQYLERFIDDILGTLQEQPARIFDYGSGPEPALITLLSERGFEVRGYDPYFNPQGESFPGGADVVTCLEVAEHFAHPLEDFAKMASCLREGGTLALGTQLLACERGRGTETDTQTVRSFMETWWYRQDPTHIVFYSRDSLEFIAARAGLTFRALSPGGHFLFTRE